MRTSKLGTFLKFKTINNWIITLLHDGEIQAEKSLLFYLYYPLILLYSIFLIALLLLTATHFLGGKSVYSVIAKSEKLFVSPYEGVPYPEWVLESVVVHGECTSDTKKMSGVLEVNQKAFIEFERINNKNLLITIFTEDGSPIGSIKSGEKIQVLSDCLVLDYDLQNDVSFTFPIDGEFSLGSELKRDSSRSPILLSGEVNVADKEVLTQEYYIATSHELILGDKLVIKKPVTQASGLVMVDSEGAMEVTFRVKAEEAAIERYRADPIILKSSFWVKAYNDQTLTMLWISLLIFRTVTKFLGQFTRVKNK